MIEIFNIVYLMFGLILVFASPTLLVIKLNKNKNDNLFFIYSINIILILNIFLIFSFFKLNLYFIFYFFSFIGFINICFLSKFLNLKKNYFFLIFVLFLLILSMKIAVNPRLEWDAAVNWIFKTKNFYDGFNFFNLKNVPGVSAYPHLGNYGWALFWKNSLINLEYTGRIFYIFIYLASIFLIINKYNLQLFLKIIITFITISITFDHSLFSGYQEPLMFGLIIFIFVLINKANSSDKLNIFHIICILNANLILWVKNEGFIFLLIILTLILIKKNTDKKIKVLFILSFALLILAKFSIFNLHFNENLIGWKGYEFLSFERNFSLETLQRLPELLYQLIVVFFKYPIYLIFVLLFFYTSIIKKKERGYVPFFSFFLLNCLLSVAIFYFTTDPKWKFHASVGMDRILYSTSGVYLIYILNILVEYFLLKKK